MSDIEIREAKNGWLAQRSHYPHLTGFGRTQEEAIGDVDKGIAVYNRSLALAALREASA